MTGDRGQSEEVGYRRSGGERTQPRRRSLPIDLRWPQQVSDPPTFAAVAVAPDSNNRRCIISSVSNPPPSGYQQRTSNRAEPKTEGTLTESGKQRRTARHF